MGRRRQIDRETVLATGRAIANEHGIEAVSMHSVARQLGVTPMALYRHVYDKSALINGIVGQVYEDMVPPDPDLPWRDRILAAGASIRDSAQRNPGVAVLLAQREPPAGSSRSIDTAIGDALVEGGAERSEVLGLYRAVTSAYLGFVTGEAGRFGWVGPDEPDADFATVQSMVGLLLDEVERSHRRRAVRSQRSRPTH
ncbi:MAG: TetR/AcrR family transcriptional regulator [Acidimicrobiales bacterium]